MSHSADSAVMRKDWIQWALILLVVYLCLAAFGWHRVLIGTETWALYNAGLSFDQQVASIRSDLVHPPLIYMIQRVWLATFGQTDNAAKALPLVFGIPTIFVFTYLSTRITQHWRLLSFLLVRPFLAIGAAVTQVRMYGLALLLVGIAMILWDRWRETASDKLLAAWVLVMSLAVYTHLFSSLLVAAFLAANWLMGPKKWKFTFASTIPGLLFLPWFLYVLPVYQSRGLDANLTWLPTNPYTSVPIIGYGFLGFFNWNAPKAFFVFKLLTVIIHLVLLFLLWRARHLVWPLRGSDDSRRRWLYVGILLAGIPVLALFLFSVLVKPAIASRFVLGALPAYWIALFLICEFNGRWGRALLLGVLLPWAVLSSADSVRYHWEPNWQHKTAKLVMAAGRPDDLLLCENPDNANAIYWEITRRFHKPTGRLMALPPLVEIAGLDIIPPTPLEQIDLSNTPRVWFMRETEVRRTEVDTYLRQRGYVVDEAAAGGVPRLTVYVLPGK